MNERFPDRHAAGNFRSRHFRLPAFVLLAGMTLVPALFALDEFTYDLRLARSLCEIEMFDYAARQVEAMQARYPQRRDDIALEQARLLFLNGKAAQAEPLINGIKPGSPVYDDSRLLMADMAMRRGNLAGAKKAYAEYFAKNSAPASTNDDAVEAFKQAVSGYAAILTQEGDGAGASKVMDYLAKIGGDDGASTRQLQFLKPQRILAAADQQADAGRPVDQAAVAAAIQQMEGLTWDQMDEITAAALVEAAHGYLLLNAPDKAIQSLKVGSEILGQVDEECRKQQNPDASPLAGAHFYYGLAQAQQATALQGKDKAAAEKQLIQALKRFQRVRQHYTGSPYASRATLQLAGVKQRLERDFGRKVDLGGEDAEVALRMEKAEVLYRTGKKAEAVPFYQDAAIATRGGSRFPAVAQRLVECYAETGRFLEAEAVAEQAADAYPTDAATAETLLRLGAALYQKAGNPATPKADAARFKSDAMSWWDRFVEVAPGNIKAPDIAFLVAEEGYARASEVKAKAQTLPEGKAQEEAKAEARALYLEAVPKYERLAAQYPAHEKGVRALYKLGWIYQATQNPAKAADAFQRYADLEANPKYNDDLLDARFLAAEQLMTVAAPEAIVRFQALQNRFAAGGAGGLDLTTATAKRVQENAMAFLGWAYDLAGEAMRPEIDELNARQAAAQADSRAAAELRQKADSTIKAAQLDQEKARSDYTETEKTLRATAATDDASQAAAPAGANELEQKLVREKAQERQKQLSGSRLKNLRDGLAGEKLDLENLRLATRAARSAVEQRLGDLQARDKALREKLQLLAAQQRRLETDLRLAEGEATAAQQALAAAQAGQERSQTALSEAKAAQKAARTPAARRQADQQRSLAARALLAAERAVREASTAAARVAGPEPLQRLATWKKNLATVKQEHGQRQTALREIERNSRLDQAERAWQDSRLAWITAALKRNAMSAGLLEKGGLAAWDSSSELAAATTADLKALRTATDQRLALADLRIAQAKEDLASADDRIRRDQAVVKETDTAIQPVLAKINVFKKQARDQFQAYLAKYPQGKHAPDAMARIGTILLDERQFDAAATILNELAAKYPDSKAVSRANYSLGRARLETNQPAEAAKAFQRVLAQAQTQPAGNLDYIADKMLAAGHPQLALAAAQELKRRSDDPKNPDRARLASLRETILFRTAAAALQCQRPADTITDLETLLREKPSSSYFFEAKLLLAGARLAATPPNPEGAQRDVADVVQYATDPVLTNRGLVLMGEALAAAPSRENLQQAAARYQQVVLLADPAVAANRPLLEQAVYESARLFSRLGDTANRDRMVKKYQDDWPAGRFTALITKLPAADFPPPPPPPAAN